VRLFLLPSRPATGSLKTKEHIMTTKTLSKSELAQSPAATTGIDTRLTATFSTPTARSMLPSTAERIGF